MNTKTQGKLRKYTPAWICVTALFMGLNVAFSSFGIPVPGGHLYLCDIVICTAALILDPLAAFLAGGVGSFIGDFLFYPLPMFVSLVVHGLQAVVISVCVHHIWKNQPSFGAVIGLILGSVVMVTGYFLGKTFVYSTFEYALMKLPYEILQAVIGAAAALLLCWKYKLPLLLERTVEEFRE